ncbi:MAG: hypothetical protein A3E83_08535 [Gammaproteobacteria bacterium RIFCSPHIGHO2_12_FULL_41_20]|nr:MAG: hypothetical protein A3E83_08535 [Gammaproteobacteria bacterium RIFCSPHIGHO2_12_FULL_41_20]
MANSRNSSKTAVHYLRVHEEYAGQRIDNFLISRLKKVPKAHIYRILRKGEVRVNKKRIEPSYHLAEGDEIRLPPLHLGETAKQVPPSEETKQLLANRILYEDKYILVINKPPGMAVHAGSQVRLGVVEILRSMYPRLPHLELAHRLDSDTSGCLILCKKRSILKEVHCLFREDKVRKLYWALTKGHWQPAELKVEAPLHRYLQQGGERLVKVHAEGKDALTIFHPLEVFTEASLVAVTLHTGRTHQIRVHAQYQDHSIAGDQRYGDADFNEHMRCRYGLRRLFLHAKSIQFVIPSIELSIEVTAPLDPELEACLARLQTAN